MHVTFATFARMSAPPEIKRACDQYAAADAALALLPSHNRAPALYQHAKAIDHAPIRTTLIYRWWPKLALNGAHETELATLLESTRHKVSLESILTPDDGDYHHELPEFVEVWQGGHWLHGEHPTWTTDRRTAESLAIGTAETARPFPQIWGAKVNRRAILLVCGAPERPLIVCHPDSCVAIPASLRWYDPETDSFTMSSQGRPM